jgi:hypothetical protein
MAAFHECIATHQAAGAPVVERHRGAPSDGGTPPPARPHHPHGGDSNPTVCAIGTQPHGHILTGHPNSAAPGAVMQPTGLLRPTANVRFCLPSRTARERPSLCPLLEQLRDLGRHRLGSAGRLGRCPRSPGRRPRQASRGICRAKRNPSAELADIDDSCITTGRAHDEWAGHSRRAGVASKPALRVTGRTAHLRIDSD